MAIPRLQLFELEDLPWFPTVIRDLATHYLHFMETPASPCTSPSFRSCARYSPTPEPRRPSTSARAAADRSSPSVAICSPKGLISQWRAYTVEEMQQLTIGLGGHQWTVGQVGMGAKPGHVTYLLGHPEPV